jgi:uncharacterized protein with PIN domain
MIVDSSALLASLFNESDVETYARALTNAGACRISAANFVEVAIVVEAQTEAIGSRQFDAFGNAGRRVTKRARPEMQKSEHFRSSVSSTRR